MAQNSTGCHLSRRYCMATSCPTQRTCLPEATTVISCAHDRHRPCRPPNAQLLTHLADGHAVVALSINYAEASRPLVYGHIWALLANFYFTFVRERIGKHAALLTIYLPAPDLSLGRSRSNHDHRKDTWLLQGGSRYFEEIEGLFSNNVTRLVIKREPWVPFCFRGCCWSYGPPPQGRIALIHEFPEWRAYALRSNIRRDWDFRDGLRQSLHAAMPKARTVTWLVSSGSNQRRLFGEARLVELVRASLPRGWKLHSVSAANVTYLEEVNAIASSTMIVSLFGSALHNMRFMLPNSTVVEIHGALKSDFDAPTDWMYCRMARRLGIRWAGFAATSFRPILLTSNASSTRRWTYPQINGISTRSVAFVDGDTFVAFFRRVVVAHESGDFRALLKEYKERVDSHPDPHRLLRSRRGGKSS